MEMTPIAHVRSDFPEKFGIPRQSGLVEDLAATVVFVPEFRNPDALRGLEGFSHIWLIWEFSASVGTPWSPTVRPPRLGGNVRMGVFATRSPFRPNPLGLSPVRLEKIEQVAGLGTVLRIRGADLMDGTPVYDIKPYVPYVDAVPDAVGGFASEPASEKLVVDCPPACLDRLPEDKRQALISVLAFDPRPPYHHDPERVYSLDFAGVTVRFRVEGERLTVLEIAGSYGNQVSLDIGHNPKNST